MVLAPRARLPRAQRKVNLSDPPCFGASTHLPLDLRPRLDRVSLARHEVPLILDHASLGRRGGRGRRGRGCHQPSSGKGVLRSRQRDPSPFPPRRHRDQRPKTTAGADLRVATALVASFAIGEAVALALVGNRKHIITSSWWLGIVVASLSRPRTADSRDLADHDHGRDEWRAGFHGSVQLSRDIVDRSHLPIRRTSHNRYCASIDCLSSLTWLPLNG
jgi:hypothetical protein